MRHLFTIIMTALCLSLYAVEYAPLAPPFQEPQNPMQSVNNTSFMTSGSTYSSTVYAVGASSPMKSRPGATRKALPGTGGESTYDPNNPQFAPLSDALLPWLVLALGYGLFVLRRRRNQQTHKT